MSEDKIRQLTELLEREKDFLRGQAMGLARKGEDAEDLYQDTVMKAFKGFESFEPDTNFRAWIGRIMLNTHINNYNRRKIAVDVSCDMSSGECDTVVYHAADEDTVAETDNPEKVFFSQHIDGRIMQSLYSLPDSYRKPFTLYHLEGYSYEEIGKMLDVPIGTVKSRIFRARRWLREKIAA